MLLYTEYATVWHKQKFYMHSETKNFMWFILSQYVLLGGIESNPHIFEFHEIRIFVAVKRLIPINY